MTVECLKEGRVGPSKGNRDGCTWLLNKRLSQETYLKSTQG